MPLPTLALPADFAAALDAVMLDADDVFRYETVAAYKNPDNGRRSFCIKTTVCCSVVVENDADLYPAAQRLYDKVKATRW